MRCAQCFMRAQGYRMTRVVRCIITHVRDVAHSSSCGPPTPCITPACISQNLLVSSATCLKTSCPYVRSCLQENRMQLVLYGSRIVKPVTISMSLLIMLAVRQQGLSPMLLGEPSACPQTKHKLLVCKERVTRSMDINMAAVPCIPWQGQQAGVLQAVMRREPMVGSAIFMRTYN